MKTIIYYIYEKSFIYKITSIQCYYEKIEFYKNYMNIKNKV